MQVHEKEDVELDVLNLRGSEDAIGKDQGHIITLGAPPERKESRQRQKAKPSPLTGEHSYS